MIAAASSKMQTVKEAALRFALAPASARPLAALRIGLAGVLLVQALAVAASVLDLFGPRGIVQWPLADTMVVPGVPRMGWLTAALVPLGLSEAFVVRGVFVLYVAGLSMLLFGWRSRLAAVLAWFTHLILFMGVRTSLYGVDDFAHIALFYCMFFPVGNAWSLDVASGRASAAPSWEARLGLRVLQIHLCIVYLSSGLEKALTPPYMWLDGEVIWKTAMLPEFRQFDMEWLAHWPMLAKLAAWGSLGIELGYAFLVWPKATRRLMAISTLGLHLGIAVFLGLVSFGAIMMVLTAAAWLVPADPESHHRDTESTEKSHC
ncbi:MAG: HTTM domain-containing protein [Gemmataceae bacterium]|nr:HTTM domain-containing protein [Gemmataceae bacterium]